MEKRPIAHTNKQQYSDTGFWQKIKNFALSAGREVVEKALWLYYAAQEKDTPLWAKTAIFSALANIPQALPIVTKFSEKHYR
jgi:uncharacterized membrane protein YkvA (DUF1232 family)